MNSGKLSHVFGGLFASWAMGYVTWLSSHWSILLAIVPAFFSVRASLWTAKAAKNTIALNKAKREQAEG